MQFLIEDTAEAWQAVNLSDHQLSEEFPCVGHSWTLYSQQDRISLCP